MSSLRRQASFESRTQSIGKKRNSKSEEHRPRKRRRNSSEYQTRDLPSTQNNFSVLSNQVYPSENSKDELDTHAPSQTASLIEGSASSDMADLNYGRNRLAMGFVKPQVTRKYSKSSGEISDTSSSKVVLGVSSDSPIEISDEEMESVEGGIVINLHQDDTPNQVVSSDDDTQSRESGEIAPTPKNPPLRHGDSIGLFTVDATPTTFMKRLADLNSAELEEQLKYALFHLNRDQIDLSRPVVCLSCNSEGHLNKDCKGESKEIFPFPKLQPDAQVRLWISCCVCASKSHLVGDCPHAQDYQAKRWSLKTFNSEQIINMSLETGTKKLEKEAENRNMRPAGLQIKGRAGLHNTGGPRNRGTSDDDDDEPFLRQPVGRKPAATQNNAIRPRRYDRYDPPANGQSYRGGGEWYATNSFGRRRSRSPEDRYDSYRPRDGYGSERDSWRPPPPDEHREPFRSRPNSPPRGGRPPPSNGSARNIQFSLPTRKGSNSWSQNGQSSNGTSNNNNRTGGGPSKKKSRRPRQGRG